ncbi:sensor histidine kinase [Paenibacillus montaniterrae]|uniref:Sensor histidine kinase n=1 Tax=Paenibacillus montaniterrae TaxID=429341 RepID=A0A919YQ20_9BACL|nr:sensor histidine kinase [Paenibacillus montaniterrae]GIP14883.1 sensor histidine kinase [Paenibacillus montaniterrae]
MTHIWRKVNLRWSMSLLFLGISLLSMIWVALFSHINYSQAVKEDFHTVTDEAAKRLNHHIEFYLDHISSSTRTLANTDNVQAWFEHGESMSLLEIEDIEAQLRRSIAFQFPEVVGIFLKSTDRRVLSAPSYSFKEPDYNQEPWYDIAVSAERRLLATHTISYPQNKSMNVISILVPVFSRTNLALIGDIVIDLSLSEIETTMTRSKIGETGQFMLLSHRDTIVYADEKSWRGAKLSDTPLKSIKMPDDGGVQAADWHGTSVLLSASTSQVTGWKVVAMVPFDEMASGYYSARQAAIFSFAVIAFVVMLIIPVLSNLFVSPILRLQYQMKKVAQGDYTARANPEHANGEFQKLSESFNQMVAQLEYQLQQITDLKLQELQARLQQKEAQIQALQNQINPHLLYNSLDVIKSIGLVNDDQLVVSMAGNLADVYRYTADISDDEVLLIEELTILEKYLEMTAIRFPKKFKRVIKVEPVLYNCRVVKLVLQPIVENAVKYAVESGTRGSLIKVHAYEDNGDLVMEVSDNGSGMLPEVQAKLSQDLQAITHNSSYQEMKQRKSLGLANVHARLFLRYGQPYGISIASVQGEGTLITIRHPLKPSN